MLEYLDFDSRRALLSLIYNSYAESRKNMPMGVVSMAAVAEWENYRYRWLHDHLISKLNPPESAGSPSGGDPISPSGGVGRASGVAGESKLSGGRQTRAGQHYPSQNGLL